MGDAAGLLRTTLWLRLQGRTTVRFFRWLVGWVNECVLWCQESHARRQCYDDRRMMLMRLPW